MEDLLHPENHPKLETDILERRFVDWKEMNALEVNQAYWTYAMINTERPLEEKIALFWHGIFCTGNSKCEHGRQIKLQIDMFRERGLGSFKDLLLAVRRPVDGVLPGQLHEPPGRHKRELGPGTAGTLLHGRGYGRRIQLL